MRPLTLSSLSRSSCCADPVLCLPSFQIWDDFCARPGNIRDGTSVADSCDHFDLFKEDITLMKSLGVNSYRFSLSWSRIIPGGGQDDPVSEAGIAFYNALINECLSHDITPFATLYQ